MRTTFSAVMLVALAFTGGCAFEHASTGVAPSTPTNTSGQTAPTTTSYVGTWSTSTAPVAALNPSTCGNLQWAVSSQTATQITGTFSAQCAGGMFLSGTASGQIADLTQIPITIEGTGSMPGLPSCAFTIRGTGTVLENGAALQVVYAGDTCAGPVRGTETLRKKSPNPDPPPPPPPPDPGPDEMDLRSAAVYNSPADVANWPITTKITALQMLGCNGGLAFTFAAQNTWPDYTPPGWDGPLQYTVWAVVNVNGRWSTSGYIQFWRGRDNTGAPILPLSCGFPVNWAYDSRWGPMNGYRPSVGERMGFFVTAGDARNVGGVTSLRERSNVVVVDLPANTGSWRW